jgi:TPR repeat protein
MNTNVINTLIENPRLLVIFFAESLPSVALAYWLVWLVMRPKSNSGIHTPFSWHLYGIAISLLGFTIFHIIAMATFVGSDAYTGDKALSYPLIASAIIAGLYIRWLKQEMLKKHTNADWKETKPQDTSEKTEFIPPSRIYETEKTESIPSSYIYEIISGEMERKEYKKGLATRAFAEANGDKELAKSLYIKFRYAELFSEMELERKEKQRQQQMEDDRIESERAETQWEQQIPTKDGMAFGICSKDWVVIGMSFVAFFIWLVSKPESTPTTKTPPATVTSVPAQATPQAVTENPSCIGDCINGQGKYTYTNGETYSGDFKNSMREGHGTYIYADGSKYVGEWKNGDPVEARSTTQAAPPSSFSEFIDEKFAELAKLEELAKQGNSTAQYNLGVMYQFGKGAVAQNYTQAIFWYRKAAEQGDTSAQYNLGSMYDNGQGVVQDYNQAAYWYSQAAKQGVASAQYNLGSMYDNGQGVVQNYNQAIYWYNQAAKQGDANAQDKLGLMYLKAKGVAQNYYQAFFWFNKAAEQGDAEGQNNLGFMYQNGYGVTKDNQTAVYWYRKAAEQGYATAITNLKELGQ